MERCKILALYLPQFHQTPENDQWWGQGFTEWNVVKKASNWHKNSNQPKIPLEGYYDLSQESSIIRQAELAREYGLDGFVIYSYYSNGSLLLQKPSEIIINNPSINIEYCFSWANHDWKRTWFSYNMQMLRKQEYASCDNQIKEHFEYLLPFFRDTRYIKISNKPVFFIYDYKAIPNFDRYKEVWNNLAVKEGFDGVFFVQTLGGKTLTWNTSLFDASFNFEPTYTTYSNMGAAMLHNKIRRGLKKLLKRHWVSNIFSYKDVCNKIINRNEKEKFHFEGVFAEWDNTPRHSHNGIFFNGFNLELFEKQFRAQLMKSIENEKPMIVIDAWNEWGEGAYMEPDKRLGYGKLETIKRVIAEFDY